MTLRVVVGWFCVNVLRMYRKLMLVLSAVYCHWSFHVWNNLTYGPQVDPSFNASPVG